MNEPQTIADRIKSIAKEKKITIGKMLEDCKLSKNTLSSMQSGGFAPRIETVTKIADYLDCSVDYLLGKTEIPNMIDKQLEGVNFALYGEVQNLTDKQKEEVLKFVQFLKSKNEEN